MPSSPRSTADHRQILDELLIEDTRELQCTAPNLVALRTKDGAASLSDLVRSSLRFRPDRIPIGEVRGAGARRNYKMSSRVINGSPQFELLQHRQQMFGYLQICRTQAFRKLFEYRSQNRSRAIPLSLSRPQRRQVDRSAQLPRSRALAPAPI
jgi:type II/IV secretion system protein